MTAFNVLAVGAHQEDFLRGADHVLLGGTDAIRLDRASEDVAALRKLAEGPVDAILCVADRPDQLGTMTRLRKSAPATPIYLVTDSPQSDVARLGRAFGVARVLMKAASPEAFARSLRRALWMSRLLQVQRTQLRRTVHLRRDISALVRQANVLVKEACLNPAARSKLADFLPVVVEADVDQTFRMLRAFSKAGLPGPCDFFRNGEEAIAFLSGQGEYADRRRHPLPSLVILDLQLPRMSAFEVLEWIRREPRHKDLTVVILSSSSDSEVRERTHRLGANLFLAKPEGLEALVETVHAIAGYWAITAP